MEIEPLFGYNRRHGSDNGGANASESTYLVDRNVGTLGAAAWDRPASFRFTGVIETEKKSWVWSTGNRKGWLVPSEAVRPRPFSASESLPAPTTLSQAAQIPMVTVQVPGSELIISWRILRPIKSKMEGSVSNNVIVIHPTTTGDLS